MHEDALMVRGCAPSACMSVAAIQGRAGHIWLMKAHCTCDDMKNGGVAPQQQPRATLLDAYQRWR
jgi:hypothetical protein